jgi:hypothetical protein
LSGIIAAGCRELGVLLLATVMQINTFACKITQGSQSTQTRRGNKNLIRRCFCIFQKSADVPAQLFIKEWAADQDWEKPYPKIWSASTTSQ